MKREIVLDTETTGLEPTQGHRLVEIGCVELLNHVPSGRTFHKYFNPERDMPAEAFAVHGLSAEFLSSHPCFPELVEEFLDFIGDAPLIIHNAVFDMNFLNHEFGLCGRPVLPAARAIDTLMLAKKKNPGAPANLDDLCRRYGINNSRRTLHGALLDAELLAEVYIELIGGRQTALGLVEAVSDAGASVARRPQVRPQPLPSLISEAEEKAHAAFVETIGEGALWKKYQEAPQGLPA
ncbi:DNA polymerase III subunit epsilon [Lutibaculum baratangense]|uniref:DNA polymerase III subunit epsilon n=1 Tax=Lutibaculum baratangense AMV1 TaxID=631454 RepID=V4R282_9HYPH|nr:DNA polymerase III subunit epsilon [Lutibaculum baratangense]ESR26052.1 DNA polymerase III epsilon subunit [Lutibaculum baratangense AMV1]